METDVGAGKQELNILTLPMVIFDNICSYLSVNELEHMSNVSEYWKAAANYTIARRLVAVENLSVAERESHTKDLSTNTLDNSSLLKKYEADTVVGKVELRKVKTTHEIEFARWSRHLYPVGLSQSLNEIFQCIFTHEVVCRWDLNLIHQQGLFKPKPAGSDDDAAEYTIVAENGQDHNICIFIEVYGNKVIVGNDLHRTLQQGITEVWEIVNVCHDTHTVTVRRLWEIYFPIPCLHVRIYCERVVVLLFTGKVCIWCPRSGDEAGEYLISKQRILGLVTDIFRIGNVMVIHSDRKHFHIIDAMTEEQGFELAEIQFLDMCFAVFESRGFGANNFAFTSILDVQLAGNVLLVKVQVLARKEMPMQAVCALKLRHFPTLQDFMTVDDFKNLVNIDDSDIIAAPGGSTMLLIPPSLVPGRLDQDNPRVKACFVTLPFSDQNTVDVFDIVDSQGTSNNSPAQFDLKFLRSWIARSSLSKTSS